ncbi:hypothetical protein GHT06_018017 [Daphnia sinensis]|uniref:Renin receptor n=1 Tax=Daphnia sinensis TaxID=1820382 RepID=A0AAD5KN39_9CRUS|nr:hypothetical protein GHT06_018017 [Daphnia sinensis]
MKAILAIVGFVCLFNSALANGEFSILHSPNGINFKGDEQLNTSELPKIISTAMGHTTPSGDSWNGLTILNPFNYPEVTISIVVEGVQSLQLSEPRYQLEITSDLYQVKNDFTSILGQMVFDENDVYSGDIQEKLPLQKLDNKDVAVLEFLKDVGVLMDLKQKVLSKSPLKTVWIQLNGLDDVVRVYGRDSEQAVEALTVLKSALTELQDALESTYGDRYMLTTITNERLRLREKRSTSNAKEKNELYWKLNLSKRYGKDYASIFNILLWTSVFLIAALISTAVFICTLDPGRDSIIYRMTTQRIKKEN